MELRFAELYHLAADILKPHGLSVISVKIFEYFAAPKKYFAAPSRAAAPSLGTTDIDHIENENARGHSRQQGDLIGLIAKISVGT
jgi:hypothetical protein